MDSSVSSLYGEKWRATYRMDCPSTYGRRNNLSRNKTFTWIANIAARDGGCRCSSRKPPQLHGTPVFYYFPPASEEYESLTSDDSAATAFTSRILDDLNLDRSTPDTYRSPPAPIPFEVVLGHPQSRGSQVTDETLHQHSFEITSCKVVKLSDCKAETESLLASPKKTGIDLVKSNSPIIKSAEEEDACPTCLEEYDGDNPRIVAKCSHHFHLSCILEWMERSQTCPICDQEMIYETL